jgi:hypothetical protein
VSVKWWKSQRVIIRHHDWAYAACFTSFMPDRRRMRIRLSLPVYAGRMLTFAWKKFSGSYLALSSRSRL